MMNAPIIRTALLVFGFGSLALFAQEEKPETETERVPAQEEKKAPLFKFTKVDVRSFESLPLDLDDATKVGFLETFESDTHLLLEVNATITPLWTEDLQRINIDTKKILLASDAGRQYPMVGEFTYGFLKRKSWNSFSAYRPTKWKETKAPVPYNAVFLVPRDAKNIVFTLEEVSTELAMPGKTSRMPAPAEAVTVEVVKASLMKEIPGGDLSRDVKEKSTIRPLRGALLELTIKVTPKEGNSTMEKHFFWHTPWIGLIVGDKVYCPTLGEKWGSGISTNVSHNKSNYTGTWSSDEATFYFAVPEDLTDFQVTWLLTSAAKGSVGKK
jgi:hypothetical protein